MRVEEGDIAFFAGDAVVNAANNHLVMVDGVAGALRARGGPTIQAECDEYVRREGPLALGEVAVTGSGALSTRWVIHAASMGDEPPTPYSIRRATLGSLRTAAERGVSSIAFPVLGAGVGGFSFEEAARLMIDAVRIHGESSTLPDLVVFYGYTPAKATTLRRLLDGP
jgi:O-acetyl-ADP-ribose deacetylase (regulator of RNase III)